MVFAKPLDQVEGEDVERLLTDKVEESQYLDYKREPYGRNDQDKKEFLFDVSAFANAYGGLLIIGVDERGGIPVNIVPVADAERLQDDLLRSALSAIDPRIPGLKSKAIQTSRGYVVVLQIPRSSRAPHMVTFKSTNKFYRRHGRDKHLMSVGEIGDAFVLSAQRIDKERGVIEAWQRSRANASSTWPTLFVGTLPLQYYPRLIEPSERWVHELLAHPPSPPGPPNTVWEGIPELDDTTEDEEIIPDLDGLLRRRKNAEHLSSFHLGRNALLTLKSTHILNSAYDNEIDPRLLISTTVHFLRVSASLAEKLGFEGEMVTCLTLEDLMKREHIRMRPSVPRNETQWQRTRQQAQPCPFSRLTPEPVLWSTSDRPDRTAKRLLDMVYNAFHFGGTPLFSDSHFDRDATAPSA